MMTFKDYVRTADLGEPLTFRARIAFDGEIVKPTKIRSVICEIRKVDAVTKRTAEIDELGPKALTPDSCMFYQTQPWEHDGEGFNFCYIVPTDRLPTSPGLYICIFTFYGNDLTRTINYLIELEERLDDVF